MLGCGVQPEGAGTTDAVSTYCVKSGVSWVEEIDQAPDATAGTSHSADSHYGSATFERHQSIMAARTSWEPTT